MHTTDNDRTFVRYIGILQLPEPLYSRYAILDPWTSLLCIALCITSTILGIRVIRKYRKFLNDDHEASNMATYSLLTWLSACEIISGISNAYILTAELTTGLENLKFPIVYRLLLGTRVTFSLVCICISIHVIAKTKKVFEKFDQDAYDYYGIVCGLLSLIFTHPLCIKWQPLSHFCYKGIHVFTISCVCIAVLFVFGTNSNSITTENTKKERETSTHMAGGNGSVSKRMYNQYRVYLSALFLLLLVFYGPWMIFGQVRMDSYLPVVASCLCVSSSGIIPMCLLQLCPDAMNRQDTAHDHQD